MIDYPLSQFNTPADGSWYISVIWTVNTASSFQREQIHFLPTLGVDLEQTDGGFPVVNSLLNATIQELNNKFAIPAGLQVDIWELINWVYVVHYWSLLYDVGQVQPTLYERNSSLPVDFISHQSSGTNNIFVNDTLFEIYAQYFQNTIIPLLEGPNGNGHAWSFRHLDSTNSLTPVNVGFFLQYTCTQTQIKKALSLVTSIIIADYTFLNPTLSLIILFGAWYSRKRNPRDGSAIFVPQLITGNWCEGCAAKERNEVVEVKGYMGPEIESLLRQV